MLITRDQLTGRTTNSFVAEASSLGLKPGEWPIQLQTTVGNGLPFLMVREVKYEGDLAWVEYAQMNGCAHLKVLND